MHWLLYIFFRVSGHLVEEVVAEVDARSSLQRSGKIEAGRSPVVTQMRGFGTGELLLWKFSVQKRQKKCCVVEVLVEAAQQKFTTIRKKTSISSRQSLACCRRKETDSLRKCIN